jgi:hypothetical protein
VIGRLAAAAERYWRAKERRARVLTAAFLRRLGRRRRLTRTGLNQPRLERNLLRDLPAPCAFIAIEKVREEFGLVGIDPYHDPGLTPRLFKRVADVAHYRLPGRDGKSVQRAPLFPCRLQALRGTLSACDQLWITHRATPSPENGPAPARCLPGCAGEQIPPDSTSM